MRLPDRRCGTRRLSQHKASGGPRGSDGRAGRLHDNSSGVDDLAVAGPSPSCPTLLRLSHPSVMTAAARARRGGMVPRHLFDANISIYIRRRRPAEILKRFRALQPGDTVIPVITYGELLWRREEPGASASGRSPLDDLINLIPIAAASSRRRRDPTIWNAVA